jgi:hypothetical protein
MKGSCSCANSSLDLLLSIVKRGNCISGVLIWVRAFSAGTGTIHEITRNRTNKPHSVSCDFADRSFLSKAVSQDGNHYVHRLVRDSLHASASLRRLAGKILTPAKRSSRRFVGRRLRLASLGLFFLRCSEQAKEASTVFFEEQRQTFVFQQVKPALQLS